MADPAYEYMVSEWISVGIDHTVTNLPVGFWCIRPKSTCMTTAQCLNSDCDKEDWRLTKHPSEYARGVKCPDCGTTRVEHDAQPQQGQQGGQTAAQAPAPAQQGQGGQPAPMGQEAGQLPSTEDAMAGGMQVGSLLAGLGSDDPQKKAASQGRAMKMAGTALAQLGDHHEQQQKQRSERAKQTSDDDLRVASDYPECPECGGLIKMVPENEFDCPHCGIPLEFSR